MEVIMSSPIQESSGMENDRGDGVAKLTKSQRKRKGKLLKKKLHASSESLDKREDTKNPNSKLERPHFYIISMSSLQDNPNTGLGTTATVDQKKTASSIADGKCSISNGEVGSITTTNLNIEGIVESKKIKKSRGKKPTSGENLNPPHLKDMETVIGETGSDTASKKRDRKKSKNKNSSSSDILSTCESTQDMVIAKKASSAIKVLKSSSGEMVSGKTTIPDATVSKGEEHTKPANGEMGSSGTTNLNVNGTMKEKQKPKSKKERPTIGENLNPRCLQDMETANGETGSVTIVRDDATSKKKRQKGERSKNKKPASGHILSIHESTLDMVNTKKDSYTNNILEAKSTDSKIEDCPKRTTARDADSTMIKSIRCTEVPNSEIGSSRPTSRKKLLIFDVNGLLADIVRGRPKDVIADKYIPKRAIFKRPFLDDFLRFCFERFDVAIWSSRTWKVLGPVVDYLLGNSKKKLLFIWDASNCTKTSTGTLENCHKCIVFKDLRKIWNGPRGSWVKERYNETNTLLLDDSPYKALLNPKHTGVFPVSYSYRNRNDDFLGPNGDLRTYLEGLAAADDMKTYVEQHPFGQGAIDETNPNWAFYSRVLNGKKKRYNW